MIAFVVFFHFFSFISVSSTEGLSYLNCEIYNSPTCNHESLSVHEIIPFSFNCTNEPFGEYSVFEYFDAIGIVNFTFTEIYQFWGSTTCTESKHEVFSVPLSTCFHFIRNNQDWYLNLTVLEKLPYYRNGSRSGFLVKDMFLDENCEQPYDKFRKLTSSTTVIYNLDYGEDHKIYMTNDYVVQESSDVDFGVSYLYLLDDFEKKCKRDSVFNDEVDYIIFHWENESTVSKDYFSKAPSKSIIEYDLVNYSFDKWNCSSPVGMSPRNFDKCTEGLFFSTSENIRFRKFYFEDYDCLGDPKEIRILENPISSLYTTKSCYYSQDNYGLPISEKHYLTIPMYQATTLSDDPYYPSTIAQVDTFKYKCGDDLSEMKKNPGLVFNLLYFIPDLCEPTTGFKNVEKIGLSMKGYCDLGKLKLKIYYQTTYCVGGSFDIEIPSLCLELEGNKVRHIVCIPRYCDGFSENDLENVCNGRGNCVHEDYCDCGDGYEGDFCELWSCYGIDSASLHPKPCMSNGDCVSPDKCVCKSGFTGEKCGNDDILRVIIILSSVFSPLLLLFLIWVCCFFLIFCFCCITIFMFCLSLISSATVIGLIQKKRLSKFEKLDDFEVILKEQLLERDSTVPHLKIDKLLFTIPFEEVELESVLGKGGSDSTVYLANWKSRKVAFKCFRTRAICSDQQCFDAFEAEMNLLVNMNHPGIIRSYGASLKPPRVGIVMEYCEKGEILIFLKKYREDNDMNGYQIKEKLRMCKEISAALEYVHSRNVIHRDVKSENVLIDSSEKTKLMDFGISRIVQIRDSQNNQLTVRVGTNVYMAPEVITGKYDEKCDTFSFAILLWVIFTEIEEPYGPNSIDVEYKVSSDPNYRPDIGKLSELPENSQNFTEWLEEIVVKCWDNEPKNRFNFEELSSIFEKKTEQLSEKVQKEDLYFVEYDGSEEDMEEKVNEVNEKHKK